MADALAEHAASIVRRARVGDQNAMALMRQVGKAAREGSSAKAKKAYALMQKYINRNPAEARGAPGTGGLFGFGGDVAGLPPAPPAGIIEVSQEAPVSPAQKPSLPRGAFDRIFDPDVFPVVVLRACKYQSGLPAAAVVLASGPSLTKDSVREMGLSSFGSEPASEAFFHGVKNCTDADLQEAGKLFDDYLKKPFLVGQCVGRAWRLQAIRRPNSRIGLYSTRAGWEMGE